VEFSGFSLSFVSVMRADLANGIGQKQL